jgi:hypothetical protein
MAGMGDWRMGGHLHQSQTKLTKRAITVKRDKVLRPDGVRWARKEGNVGLALAVEEEGTQWGS